MKTRLKTGQRISLENLQYFHTVVGGELFYRHAVSVLMNLFLLQPLLLHEYGFKIFKMKFNAV